MKRFFICILLLPVLVFGQLRVSGGAKVDTTKVTTFYAVHDAISDSSKWTAGSNVHQIKPCGGKSVLIDSLFVATYAEFQGNVVLTTAASESLTIAAGGFRNEGGMRQKGTATFGTTGTTVVISTAGKVTAADTVVSTLGIRTEGPSRQKGAAQFGATATPTIITTAGDIGQGTLIPYHNHSIVNAGGVATGLHIVNSAINKRRDTIAQATDSASVRLQVLGTGIPMLRYRNLKGDTMSVFIDASRARISSPLAIALNGGGSSDFIVSGTAVYCGADYTSLGTHTAQWQYAWLSDGIYLGGKGQTATQYISKEKTIAGQDSSHTMWVNADGNPEHIFAGANGHQWKLTVGSDDKLSFYYKQTTSWIKKASIDSTGAYTDEF